MGLHIGSGYTYTYMHGYTLNSLHRRVHKSRDWFGCVDTINQMMKIWSVQTVGI